MLIHALPIRTLNGSCMEKIKYYFSKLLKKLRLAAVIESKVDVNSKIESGTSFVNSSMGRHSFCGYDCDIFHADIGSFTSIASGVILGGARHPIEWLGMSPVFYKGRDSIRKKFVEFELPPPRIVSIGNDVWIGRNAIILPGVNVSDGAVVGAGSVVTKDVPPYAVVAGNPARVLKYRFDEDIIKSLLRIKWWNLSDDEIGGFASLCREPSKVIGYIEDRIK